MRRLCLALAALIALPIAAFAASPNLSDWPAVLKEARGQVVYFDAWGGSENVNAFIAWTDKEMEKRYGVHVVEVKLADTADGVARIVAEKAAGKNSGGSIDLIWINGQNFAAMKRRGLLYQPGWTEKLPNWKFVAAGVPTIERDFTVPVDGLECPWGMAKLVFFYDKARTDPATLPKSATALLAWAKAHPGRFTYPQPPDFMGTTFLKQVLSELAPDPSVLQRPADDANFEKVAKPLFSYLDALKPYLWRHGAAYPRNYPAMKQLLADGELDIIFAFNPSEASNAIANNELPKTVRSFTFPGGTLANTHFVAIPYNAAHKAGALALANFLISPEAQLRKQNPKYWGDPTVLSMAKLDAADRARFAALKLGPATLGPDQLGPALPEPDPSWMTRLEKEWTKRYGVGG